MLNSRVPPQVTGVPWQSETKQMWLWILSCWGRWLVNKSLQSLWNGGSVGAEKQSAVGVPSQRWINASLGEAGANFNSMVELCMQLAYNGS